MAVSTFERERERERESDRVMSARVSKYMYVQVYFQKILERR